jgi:5-methyltetrahydropteroyltriglutamate--homocysteine methyltransferase
MHNRADSNLNEYIKWAEWRVEVLNAALAGIPEDRVRYHICWGSQNTPHTWTLPPCDIVYLILKVKAGAYSIEAANPRARVEIAGLRRRQAA